MKKLASLAMAAGVAFGLAAPAAAVPVFYCKSGPGIDLINQGCISGQGKGYDDGVYTNAGGGDFQAAVEAAIFGATGQTVSLSLYGKSDGPAGLFNVSAGKSGTWDVLDDSILIKYITVKAANSFALFEFEGAGLNFGTFSTLGILNNGGKQPDMSHISFWQANGLGTGVPEPATWALMILGFGTIGGALRRRQRQTVQVSYA